MPILNRLLARFERRQPEPTPTSWQKTYGSSFSRSEIEGLEDEGRSLAAAIAPEDLAQDPSYGNYLAAQLAALRGTTAEEKDAEAARMRTLVERMLNYVPMSDRRAASVLCVGCRDGQELDALAEITGGHVHGVDLHNATEDPRIHLGDVHRLPFEDDSIDIAFACHVLEHAFDFDRAVDELFRVLRPGGWLILEVEVAFEADDIRIHDGGTRDELSCYFQQKVDDPSRDQVLAVDSEIEQEVGERKARSLRIFVHLEPPPGERILGVLPPEADPEMHRLPPAGSLVVRLDITNKCNLECIHCSLDWTREAMGEPKANLPVEDFARIAEQIFPLAKTVALSYEAEPMMHKDFLDILEIVKKYPGPGYVMTTNGTLINKKRLDALFDCGLSHLNISFDGATKETFERIREKGRFERAVKGVEMFRDRKRELGLGRHDFPALQVNYTLMRSTLEELPQMVEMCRDWDVHQLTLQHLYNMPVNKLYDESLIHHKQRSDEVLMEAHELCERYGIQTVFPRLFDPPPNLVQIGGGAAPKIVRLDAPASVVEDQGIELEAPGANGARDGASNDPRNGDTQVSAGGPDPAPSEPAPSEPALEGAGSPTTGNAVSDEPPLAKAQVAQPDDEEKRSFYCLAPWRMLKIRWNGDILPCDVWRDEPMGNLCRQSFEEIWQSRRYKLLRDGLAHDQPSHSSCIHCDTVTTDNLEGKEVSSPFAHTPRSDLRGAPIP